MSPTFDSPLPAISPSPSIHQPAKEATAPAHLIISHEELALFWENSAMPDENILFSPTDKRTFCDPQTWISFLESQRPEILITAWSTPSLPEPWLARPDCPLQYVCHLTGSIRGLIPRSFLERGGRVTNWGGIAAKQVAEHALLLALAALRNMPAWGEGNWTCKKTTRTLFGRTVGLHGYGRIAQTLVSLLKPFGTRIRAYSSGVPRQLMEDHGVEACASLRELFSNCDILVDCEALTQETAGSVTREMLRLLPDGAVFVNVGRGQIVDEKALLQEARSGRLRIGLDVVTQEPLPRDSELARLPNVILSPHIAGPTGDRFRECGIRALRNLRHYREDRPLEAEVSLEAYDRST